MQTVLYRHIAHAILKAVADLKGGGFMEKANSLGSGVSSAEENILSGTHQGDQKQVGL
jgi:hypothetical protein